MLVLGQHAISRNHQERPLDCDLKCPQLDIFGIQNAALSRLNQTLQIPASKTSLTVSTIGERFAIIGLHPQSNAIHSS